MQSQPICNKEDIIRSDSIVHNFDVSVILPFYKKLDEFKLALPINAPFFERNGIEVLVIMDEDSQQAEVLELIQTYPFINWKVIVNHQPHIWRNPTKAINVGIKHATKQYVMVCSPESEFLTDAIYLLRSTLENYPHHFAVGTVAFSFYGSAVEERQLHFISYGSIMAKKNDIIDIGGYDESLSRWGGDDDNIRARLEQYGINKMILPEVKLVHREDKNREEKTRGEKRMGIPVQEEIEIYYPNRCLSNAEVWGVDFDDVVCDWKCNRFADSMLLQYLSPFKQYRISGDISISYKRIVLVQSYNESEMINSFLDNMALYFDGIILLDDDSTDNTYENARNPKLLLKVQKERQGFIDVENRNILLDLAAFFSSEWYCFMDTDEYFDARYADFDQATTDIQTDVLSFSYINIWNEKDEYNAEYPFSRKGIMPKMRMFRNIGHCQILTDKKRVHFNLMPYQHNIRSCSILFKHYGMANQQLRKEKYEFYLQEDIAKDQKNYDHMLHNNPLLLHCKDIAWIENQFANQTL